MKTYPARRVETVLRTKFGMYPMGQGNGTGRDVWIDPQGRTCQAMLRRKEVPYAYLFCLGAAMEAKGIVSRTAFLEALRGIVKVKK